MIKVKKITVIIMFILLLTITVVSSNYETEDYKTQSILYVGGVGPNNYSTITLALVDVNNGDTIYVYNGTYNENITISNTLSLIGENRDNTIINGTGIGDVIDSSFDINNINISGFTILNSGSESGDSGIYIRGDYNKFTNCKFKNCNIGIFLATWPDHCYIYDNIFTDCGVGVYLFQCSDNYIYHNNFFLNDVNAINSATYSNNWDDGSLGNYWDNYTGTGTYSIPEGAQDNQPLTYLWNVTEPYILNIDNNINRTNIYNLTFNITWTPIKNAAKYMLKISANSNFPEPTYRTIDNINQYFYPDDYCLDGINVVFTLPPEYIMYYNMYYCKVRAFCSD